ncbi:MAG: porin, partial [Bacteroidota bacterium]|nr:porin [Bacteroidota bacterium]
MKLKYLLLITLFSTSICSLQAQEDSLSSKGTLTISGYVDSYYQYNLNKPQSGYNTGRIFDLPHNSFSLGLVQTVFSYSIKRLNVVADLTFGPNADLGNFGNEGTSRLIKQAYISYDFTDNLTFTVGQFGTHIGYELIDAPLNFNYSLSYLFGNGPFYHTGAKFDYALTDKIGLMVGVLNGWDALQDYNDKISIAAQISLAPAEGFDVFVNWIG